MSFTEAKLEELRQIIETLRHGLPKVRSVIVARNDGLPLVQTVTQGDATRIAAMTASAIGLNKRIIATIEAGDLTETSLSGTQGQILLYAAGPRAVLAIIADGKANVAMIHHKARQAANEISERLA